MRGDGVILIHGLIRSRASMVVPAGYLRRRGYDVASFPYHSTRAGIAAHSANLAGFIAEFAAGRPGAKLHFVTHSLGGIILRLAVDKLVTDGGLDIHFGRAVLIAPPNQGSRAATKAARSKLLSLVFKPLRELRDTPGSPIYSVPTPDVLEYGVVAGRWDAKVSPREARLDCAKDFLVVNAFHTFIMNRPDVLKATLRFIETGRFRG